MGQVYRARDSRLGRDVAIKVLLSTTSGDPEFLARFEREAQTLATLNHPHIASIHDIVEGDGQRGIVMEFVAGRTLGEVMSQGALPTRIGLGYAIDICDALAAAHSAGIVHRDLKPANVIIADSGTVKVLDFGIARLIDPPGLDLVDQHTRASLTADRARAICRPSRRMAATSMRAATFSASGCCCTRCCPVSARSTAIRRRACCPQSCVTIHDRFISWRLRVARRRTHHRTVPGEGPRQRYQTAADLKRALEDARDDLTMPAGLETASPPTRVSASSESPPGWTGRLLRPLGFMAIGATLGAFALLMTDAAGPQPIPVPRHKPFITEDASRTVGKANRETTALAQVRLSPDGQRLSVDAFGADHSILIYPVAGGTPVRLDRESTDQHAASWSPDGNWLAYRRLMNDRWQLVRAPVGGGAAVVIADAEAGGVGAGGATDWSSNGAWLAHTLRDGGIQLVSPEGKAGRLLAGPRSASFRFSRDSLRMIAIRRRTDRRWELMTWDVETGRELGVVALPLAASVDVQGMTLSDDETSVIVGASTPTSDIWMLEQFAPPPSPWRRWFRQ